MGCDVNEYIDTAFPSEISIHAPMWGATPYSMQWTQISDISIHAPMWGATVKAKRLEAMGYISIHAPMWGATIQNTTKA